ncbi:hypothetical protein [Paraburkholderia sp. UCT2]|uniref:hypothetical protein n=1 Tax=Paraburkholderia sp. UCT2 TaxID=2615208 RepID=UPI00223B4348|nr:hypothetical protein [Paraburkholderia sp. UCT2]
MGYDVHITRKENWFDESGLKIGIDEWKALVQSDPDMRLDGYASAIVGDANVLRIERGIGRLDSPCRNRCKWEHGVV